MNRLFVIILAMLCSSLSHSEDIEKVFDELKGILKNSTLLNVSQSAIPGIYEVQTGKNIFYYSQEKKLLIFGEIYTLEGKSLTAESKEIAKANALSQITDEIAITLGDKEAVNQIIEFSNLDCGACRLYHDQITTIDTPIKRSIILTPHENQISRKQVEHLLCIKNTNRIENDFDLIMHGKNVELETCPEAESLMKSHRTITQNMRVEGTPILFVNNVRVEGADLNKVRNLLLKEEKL